jgi:hypothetical protein
MTQNPKNQWQTAIQELPHEIERLAEIVKKRQWSHLLTEAEERALKTSKKLEEINKKERAYQKTS